MVLLLSPNLAIEPKLNHPIGEAESAIFPLWGICPRASVGHLHCEVRIGLVADIVFLKYKKAEREIYSKSQRNGAKTQNEAKSRFNKGPVR